MRLARLLPAILLVLIVSTSRAEPPNILLIVSDDQAWSDFGFMGHSEIRTPNLDRLASEQILFPYSYVPASLRHRWIVQGNWKLILPHAPNLLDARIQLYDIASDPAETKNYSYERPDTVRQLHNLLQEWRKVE